MPLFGANNACWLRRAGWSTLVVQNDYRKSRLRFLTQFGVVGVVVRARKTSRISEFSGGRLFEKIEWGPPLKTEKLLWVMKKPEKARIEWGGSHSILATGARRNPELRGGSHSILSKRRPLRGGSHSILATGRIQNLWVLPFCQDRMAAAPHLEVLNPFYR